MAVASGPAVIGGGAHFAEAIAGYLVHPACRPEAVDQLAGAAVGLPTGITGVSAGGAAAGTQLTEALADPATAKATEAMAAQLQAALKVEAATDVTKGVPGIDRPFRAANEMFPPNAAVMEKMAGMKIFTGTDCSEIASTLMRTAGYGRILRVTGAGGQDLRLLEYGRVDSGFKYHEVFSDGRYIYDPRLSNSAVPIGDWVRMIQGLNPGAVIK